MHDKEIVKIWLTQKRYPICTIPKDFAKEYGFDKPTRAVIEKTAGGLLLKRLEF